MTATRITLAAVGVLTMLFGIVRILQNAAITKPLNLAKWVIGSEIAVDFVLLPLVTLLGLGLARTVPSRARAYLQGFLIVAATVMGLAVVMHHREGDSQPGNSLLTLNYLRTGAIVVGVVAVLAAVAYGLALVRNRRSSDRTIRTATKQPAAERQ